MRYTKIAALFIAAVLILLSVSSCGGNNGTPETSAPDATAPVTDTGAPETEQPEIKLFEYKTAAGGAVITTCRLLAEEIEVPSEIDGISVIGIGEKVFLGIDELETVVVPEGVLMIGDSAFENCRNLKNVTLPSTLSSVGARAFRETPWYESLDDEFTVVGDGVLIKYSGESPEVVLPDGIGYLTDAFENRDDITSVAVSDGVRTIGSYAFSGMDALEKIEIPQSVRVIGSSAFSACRALREITIPEGVESIGEFLFSRCVALEKAALETKSTYLPKGTFIHCGALKEVVLPEGLTEIGVSAFEDCPSLETVNLPESLTKIADSAFDEGTPVTCRVSPGSYAESFCTRLGINFTN